MILTPGSFFILLGMLLFPVLMSGKISEKGINAMVVFISSIFLSPFALMVYFFLIYKVFG